MRQHRVSIVMNMENGVDPPSALAGIPTPREEPGLMANEGMSRHWNGGQERDRGQNSEESGAAGG